MKINHALFILIASLVVASCTVQKRVHRKGWFVQWHFDKNDSEKKKESSIASENSTTPSQVRKAEYTPKTSSQTKSVKTIATDGILQSGIEVDSITSKKSETLVPNTSKESKESKRMAAVPPDKIAPGSDFYIPLLTFIASTVAGLVIIATTGFPPILIAVVVSALIAFIFVSVALNNKNKYPRVEAKSRGRKNLIRMLVLIGLTFLFTAIIAFSVLPNWVAFTLLLLIGFALLVGMARDDQQVKDNLEKKKEPVSTEEKSSEKEVPNENVTIIRALSKAEAFPGLTGGMIVFFVLALVLGLALLFIAWIASITGIALGLYFTLAAGIAVFLLVISFVYSVKRDKSYAQYIEDLYQESQVEKEKSNGANPRKNTSDNRTLKEKKAAENKTAIAGAIVMFGVVLLLTLFLLFD